MAKTKRRTKKTTKKPTKKAAARKPASKKRAKKAAKKAAAKRTTRKAPARTAGMTAGKTASRAKAYRPFYKYARPAREISADSPANELQSASRGPEALTTLRRFLKQNTPANEEYQDAFHRNRVRAARFELMRLEYLHGHVAAGDKLLARLQDLDRGDE